jgi:catalase
LGGFFAPDSVAALVRKTHLEDDHWEQPGNLFRKMTPEQKQLLFDNTARAIKGASQEVQERHVANCRRADPAYGDGVARALKLNALQTA